MQVFSSWYEDVHVVWILLLDYFLSLFPLRELSHFSTSAYRQWVPCERNSSYNFIPIFLKLCTCFWHGLKMCMWFGYNPCINFYHFFQFVNFLTSDSMKVYRQRVPCERNSSYNFILIFLKLCTCFLHELLKYVALEMCMWFGYNPWINFCHFFHFVNFVIFWLKILWKCIDLVPCNCKSFYNINPFFMQLCTSFFHGLKMCMWFEFNPAVNFCHFSTLLTLSFFNFSQVWHQLHRS